MTKEVLLALKGLQFDTGGEDGDKIETIMAAEYYKKDDSHYVIYDEAAEGFLESTKSIIKFRENYLELTKKGLINVHMIFEEKKKNMASYSTPYGDILIGIDTRRMEMSDEEEHIVLDVDYALEVNYEHFADCRIKVDIKSKNGSGFTLQ